MLSIHQGAGVSKKTKKGRNISSKARKRLEKGQDRAAAIMERTERKVAKSKGKARTIQTRSKAWDDINNQIPANKKKSEDEANDEDWTSELDDDMDNAEAQVEKAFEGIATTDKAPLLETMEDDDGIL